MVRATGRAVVLESRAHRVSKNEVVYTSDPLERISDDRRQQGRGIKWLTFDTTSFLANQNRRSASPALGGSRGL